MLINILIILSPFIMGTIILILCGTFKKQIYVTHVKTTEQWLKENICIEADEIREFRGDRLAEIIEEYHEQFNEEEDNPYGYFPQCDVEGCKGVSCSGGECWNETGYWCVCPKHSQEFRDGKPQPKMKQSAIDRENSRDENGYLTKPRINNQ